MSHRDPRLLLLGQSTSRLGDGVAMVTLVLLILERWPGATHLSLYSATGTVALVVFLLAGGAIVDRFSRRTLLLISDCARALIMGLIAILAAIDHLSFPVLLLSTFAFGLLDAVFMPAATALMPEIVPEDVLPSANAASSISRSLFGGMLGPALGGLISAWSIPGALAFDVVTFLVSAVTLIMMHPTPTPRESAEAPHMLREIMSGLRFTVATKWLFWTLVGAGLINAALFTPVSTLMPLFLKQEFHASRQLIGSSIALGGVGWVIGSVIVGSLKTPKRRIRWLTVSWVVGTMVVGAISVAHHLVVALVIVFLIGPLLSYGNVMWESMMQTEVPRELLGRVSSVDWFMSLALSPIGVIVAGALSTHIGIRAYFFAAMTLCLPIMALLLLSKSVNEVDATRVAEQ